MKCPNCGEDVKPTDKQCPNCHFDLEKFRNEFLLGRIQLVMKALIIVKSKKHVLLKRLSQKSKILQLLA